MRILFCIVAAAAFATAPRVDAQDLPTTQVEDHGRVVLHDSMTRSLLKKSHARQGRRQPTAAQTSACAAKARFRAQHGANHPKVQQLYRLCRNVGL